MRPPAGPAFLCSGKGIGRGKELPPYFIRAGNVRIALRSGKSASQMLRRCRFDPERRKKTSFGCVARVSATLRDGKTVFQMCCVRFRDSERRKNRLSDLVRASLRLCARLLTSHHCARLTQTKNFHGDHDDGARVAVCLQAETAGFPAVLRFRLCGCGDRYPLAPPLAALLFIENPISRCSGSHRNVSAAKTRMASEKPSTISMDTPHGRISVFTAD